jgi:membrane protein implicated in regulation of membrane protease activity
MGPRMRQQNVAIRAAKITVGVLIGLLMFTLAGMGSFSLITVGVGPHDYDLPALLFGAATFSLIMLTVFLTVVVVVGWRDIREQMVEYAKRYVAETIEKELIGRTNTSFARVYGSMALCKTTDTLTVKDQGLLEEAIDYSRDALRNLEDSPSRWKAMNNLAFYSSITHDAMSGPIARDLALELRRMPEVIIEPEVRDTYVRVVATYYEIFPDPLGSLKDARYILATLLKGKGTTEAQKQNARRHSQVLERAFADFQREVGDSASTPSRHRNKSSGTLLSVLKRIWNRSR